jgi:hypothetical protein
MSEREELAAILASLPDAEVPAVLAFFRSFRVMMAPPAKNQTLNISPEDDAILTELISISQESGGYLPEGSRFREGIRPRSARPKRAPPDHEPLLPRR